MVLIFLDGSVDIIQDFSASQGDRIQLSRAGFSSSTGFNYNERTNELFVVKGQFIFIENKASFADRTSGYIFI